MYKAHVVDQYIGRGRGYVIVADSKDKILKMVGEDNHLVLDGKIEKEDKALIFSTR